MPSPADRRALVTIAVGLSDMLHLLLALILALCAFLGYGAQGVRNAMAEHATVRDDDDSDSTL
jgi:hypothetical protein